MNSDSASVTARARRRRSCASPSRSARAVARGAALPREPTRYAAMIVLPWPGVSACAAPQKSAMQRARRGSTPDAQVARARSATRSRSRSPSDARRRVGAVPSSAGRRARAGPGSTTARRARHVQRALEQVLRVRAQLVARARGRGRRRRQPRRRRARDDDLPPADPAGDSCCRGTRPRRRRAGPGLYEDHLEPRRAQPAGALAGSASACRSGAARAAPAVDRQLERSPRSGGELGAERGSPSSRVGRAWKVGISARSST